LLHELTSAGLPLTLVSQYLPIQYAAIRDGRLMNDPRQIVLDGVSQVLRQYANACNPAAPAAARISAEG
jgi:D-tagatose-1,6-bisphosphate aldolase subunit GatZ/KbaZ